MLLYGLLTFIADFLPLQPQYVVGLEPQRPQGASEYCCTQADLITCATLKWGSNIRVGKSSDASKVLKSGFPKKFCHHNLCPTRKELVRDHRSSVKAAAYSL